MPGRGPFWWYHRLMTRRTSRKPKQVGKWTPRAKAAERMQKGLRKGRTRKGHLSYRHVRAKEYKGRDEVFKGRIMLDRQNGVMEFPDPEQFQRIARQEKVPKAEVDKAFGHLMPQKSKRRTSRRKKKSKRRTSKKKRKSRRRTSRRQGFFSQLFSNPVRRKSIRRDRVIVPKTRDGEPVELRALTAMVPDQQAGSFGAARGILTTAAGETVLLRYEDAFAILGRWLTRKEFDKAFGHLRTGKVLGKTQERRGVPDYYGPRSMRLGHRDPAGEGPARPGIVRGQLVLYHKPTGQIVWQAYDDEVEFPHKPIWIWYGASKIHVDFPKAMAGAKIGSGDRARMVGAVDRNIPPMAMLQAFDHLLTPQQKSEAYQVFSQ